MKKILIITAALIFVTLLVGGVLLLLRGEEDVWICQNGVWIKHGSPSSAMPLEPCLGNAGSSPIEKKDNNPPLVGGDRDEHGCLIAAGYSWCEPKQKCLRTWEEICLP